MTRSTRTTSKPNLIDRYQDYRTRRFLKHESTYSNSLPRWRTQGRRRVLVGVLAASLALMVVTSVVCALGIRQAALMWLPACAVFFPAWIVLQIVLGRQSDAPTATLDEYEVAQRNSARSIGLSVIQSLMLVPIFFLIIVSTHLTDADAATIRDLAYAGALMALAALMIGSCLPAMILGWIRRSDTEVSGT
ncbi:membrane protein [Mycobacterium sp. SWH-M5]|nr:membrane protein [Mycobacterium sp. SWH-M5]